MSGFMAIEQLIVDRLKAALGDSVHVLTAANLAGVAEESQPTPAVHVVYQGMAISGNPLVKIEERWATVIVIRNVARIKSGQSTRQEAGPMMDAVYAALRRFRPAPGYSPMMPMTPSMSGYSAGYGYFPLLWGTGFNESTDC